MSMVPSSGAPSSDAPSGRSEGADNAVPPGTVLEREVPLSQSLIWQRQREFYMRRGLKAWTEDLVPAYITNNPFIAEIYAHIVLAFLKDTMEPARSEVLPVSPVNPLRILELGAGSGKFSYLFLSALIALLRAHRMAPDTVRYCMTDCAENVVDEWHRNNYLAGFVGQGILEFETVRAGEPIQSSFLHGEGGPKKTSGPLVVIANYVFDSLPNDAFVVQQGQISEALMTTSVPARAENGGSEENTATRENATSRLAVSFVNNAAVPPQRYADPIWMKILDDYRSLPSTPGRGATILFPCGTLAVLEDIAGFGDGRMLVLAGDKGHAHEDALLLSQGPPAFEYHAADCFSQMVNFDAIGKYFEAAGGRALRADKHMPHFSICGFLAGRTGERFPATESAYGETQKRFGPDDLFTLLAWLNAHMEEMTVPQILAVLRLTRWDTTAFMRLFPVLARQLRAVVAERHDLRDAALRVWANHYPVSHGDNQVAFQCGVILLELQFFEEAAVMFQAAQRLLGPSAPTSYNLGLCHQGLRRNEDALAAMKEACSLDPNFQPSQDALRKVEKDRSKNS